MDNSKEFFDELYNSEFTQIEKYVRRMLYDSNAVEDIVDVYKRQLSDDEGRDRWDAG